MRPLVSSESEVPTKSMASALPGDRIAVMGVAAPGARENAWDHRQGADGTVIKREDHAPAGRVDVHDGEASGHLVLRDLERGVHGRKLLCEEEQLLVPERRPCRVSTLRAHGGARACRTPELLIRHGLEGFDSLLELRRQIERGDISRRAGNRAGARDRSVRRAQPRAKRADRGERQHDLARRFLKLTEM